MELLERAKATECGVDPEGILNLYKTLEGMNVHSVMITRHNKVIAEGWWAPYRKDENHILYSVSKSFVGTAIGFAVQEGLLSTEDYVLDIFADVLPSCPCENMKKMKIRHVLTMSTGQKDERNIFHEGESWLYSLLSAYVDNEPGETFRYISSSTYILSAVIWKLTGQTVFEYLKDRLFEPLGFSEHIWWEKSPEGLNTGFNGFNATAEDVTKLALLYLNRGKWKGRQILSEEWVKEASGIQIDNRDNDRNQELGYRQGFGTFTEDYRSGYGYLFWHCKPEGSYRGDGIFGQLCIIMPKQDMTIAVAAGCEEPGKILEAIWNCLLPAVDAPHMHCDMEEVLYEALENLKLPVAAGEKYPPSQEKEWRQKFLMAENGMDVQSLELEFRKDSLPVITIETSKGKLRAKIGYLEWEENETGYDPEGFSCDNVIFFHRVACTGAWKGEEYVVKFAYTETPFVDILRIRLRENSMEGIYTHTVKYGKKEYHILGIKSQEET